jgi:hypothetical protein
MASILFIKRRKLFMTQDEENLNQLHREAEQALKQYPGVVGVG